MFGHPKFPSDSGKVNKLYSSSLSSVEELVGGGKRGEWESVWSEWTGVELLHDYKFRPHQADLCVWGGSWDDNLQFCNEAQAVGEKCMQRRNHLTSGDFFKNKQTYISSLFRTGKIWFSFKFHQTQSTTVIQLKVYCGTKISSNDF